MLSEKQLEANRANAQKSTGPRTAEGKQRSRLNALRHGLSGHVVVMPGEDHDAFQQFTREIVESLNPETAVERQLAHSYASFQWRINRAAAVEDNMFTLGLIEELAENLNLEDAGIHNAATQAKTFRAGALDFERLGMYSQRLVHQAEKILKQLIQLQAGRKSQLEQQLYEAARVYKLHRVNNQPFDPRKNGFDLTTGQVESFVQRQCLARRALRTSFTEFEDSLYAKQFARAAA